MHKGLQIMLRPIILAMGTIIRQGVVLVMGQDKGELFPSPALSAFSSTFLCLILPPPPEAQPIGGRRWNGVEQLWLQDSQTQRCRGRWVRETILCPFLIWMLSGFPLAAAGDDSRLTESPAHQCLDWSALHAHTESATEQKGTCGLVRWWGPQRRPSLHPSRASLSPLQDPDGSIR